MEHRRPPAAPAPTFPFAPSLPQPYSPSPEHPVAPDRAGPRLPTGLLTKATPLLRAAAKPPCAPANGCRRRAGPQQSRADPRLPPRLLRAGQRSPPPCWPAVEPRRPAVVAAPPARG
ncbi:hypothetical protein DAI22_06g203000 [Oryza sativa Japonica Group]|nr:hypothetical protein DAI22_06g203000 [Oryza sativa Japonica Group]